MERDPVCGMNVDESTAAAKTQYNGTTYFFCAHGCLRAFFLEPEKYLQNQKGSNGSITESENKKK